MFGGAVEFIFVFTDFLPAPLSISDRGMLKSLSTVVDRSNSPHDLSIFALNILTLLLDTNTLMIAMSSWRIDLFIAMQYSFLAPTTLLVLKSALTETNVATPVFL